MESTKRTKKGLIIINAYCKLPNFLHQADRLKEELEKLGVSVDIKRNDSFFKKIDGDGNLVGDMSEYDFCIYLDKDKYMSHMLEKSGLRLFNSHAAIQACDDKMTTAILLADNGISMPHTMAGLICYDANEKVNQNALDTVERTLGYPMIVKTSYGSLGKGVFKVDDRAELNDVAQKLKCTPHLYQQFIKESFGKDIRVIVIGGKFISAMLRKSDNDFRSNLELGGEGESIDIPDSLKEQCEKISALLGLDYCGIDILIGKDKYYVCEVNSNAFFGGMESVSGINIAKKYAEYILRSLGERV